MCRCHSTIRLSMLLAALLVPAPGRADDQKPDKLRVLFVANSYSHWNHQPRLLEEFIKVGQKRDAEVMPFTSAGAPLSWHLKDGRAMKWLTGDTKGFIAGAERGVARMRELVAADAGKGNNYIGPYKITLNDQLREKEVELARARDGRWDFVSCCSSPTTMRPTRTRFAGGAREHKVTPIVWLPWGGAEDLKRYAKLARKLKVTLVPTSFGEEMYRSGKLAQTTSLKWGGGHPNARTTYIYDCMFYAAMINKSPEGLPSYRLRRPPRTASCPRFTDSSTTTRCPSVGPRAAGGRTRNRKIEFDRSTLSRTAISTFGFCGESNGGGLDPGDSRIRCTRTETR